MNTLKTLLPYVSQLWILIIIVAIWAWFYISKQRKKNLLIAKRHWIEMIPSAVSTLGVLGTFLGITMGLLCFNTQDLSTSIPQLLDGLKTAFFTSLAGMVCSLILSKRVNNLYDEETGGLSDINQAAGLICQSLESIENASAQQAGFQNVFYNNMNAVIQQMDANIATMNANVNTMCVTANNMALAMQNLATATADNSVATIGIREIVERIEGSTNNLNSSIGNIEGTASSIVASVGNIEEINKVHTEETKSIRSIIDSMDKSLGELIESSNAIVSSEGEVSEKITTLTDKLHSEVVEIEDKMSETNILLEHKFDEFSELLKKNNTEALVEVMKQVTIEFQTQMNTLINKLVQENFDQLNKSVEKLNQWQVENKEMIQSLTAQYKQMADNFENTSTTLKNVKDDTQALVSDGGKLDLLVKSLNEVIIKDEKFRAISSDLQKTANLSKSNMESFDESTRKLNEWIKHQRNFSDAVKDLINKLEEINEIRNYASSFWRDTKDGMNAAVGIIKGGSETLNQQLTNLDQQFYARLSTTLANLDSCIQALITNYRDR